jgi:ABC-2 type transport system permease protein
MTHAANNPANKLRWLLRREFWEHKGGFFWAPIFTGAIFLGLVLMAITIGEVTVDRTNINVASLNLGQLTAKYMTPEIAAHIATGTQVSLFMVAALFGVVTAFVLFFYCIGALYDERRDRSVLFWKSLPLSDRSTVLSKALTAVVLVPLISLGSAIVTGLAFLVMISIYVAFYGVNPLPLLWGSTAVLKAAATLVAIMPVQALWSLPTVGWLLLCSSWSKSKPFLWALAIPIGMGIIVSWFDLMKSVMTLPDTWFWKNVVARMLLSVAPGGWLDATSIGKQAINNPDDLLQFANLGTVYSTLATPQMWLGAAAGIAMIAAAVYFRRKRDEG